MDSISPLMRTDIVLKMENGMMKGATRSDSKIKALHFINNMVLELFKMEINKN